MKSCFVLNVGMKKKMCGENRCFVYVIISLCYCKFYCCEGVLENNKIVLLWLGRVWY